MEVLSEQLFVVRVTPGDGTLRVSVAGELDADSAASFRAQAAVPPQGVPRLELDLARVTFLDAAGVREILRVRRATLRRGGRFAITAASDAVHLALDVARRGAGPDQAGDA